MKEQSSFSTKKRFFGWFKKTEPVRNFSIESSKGKITGCIYNDSDKEFYKSISSTFIPTINDENEADFSDIINRNRFSSQVRRRMSLSQNSTFGSNRNSTRRRGNQNQMRSNRYRSYDVDIIDVHDSTQSNVYGEEYLV